VLFRFLDTPHLELEHQTELMHNVKPVALLIYLACQRDFVSREALTVLFNQDSSDTDALRQVRVLLARARKLSWAGGLKLEQNRLRFDVQTDVQLFREAIGAADWQRASELYKSEFLTGFRIDAQGFEAWCDTEREVLRSAWLDAALKHAAALGAQGQHLRASTLLRKVLASDELCEDVLAAYLEHCYLAGMRNEALKAFERFQGQLSTELGLEPLQSTFKLVQTIRQAAPLEVTRASRPDKSGVPISVLRPPKMIGRDTERDALDTAPEQVILVSGEPGAGKTRLLEEIMPDTRWLACLEGMDNLPYQPLIVFLRRHLEHLPDLGVYNEDLARLIPELLPNTSIRKDDPISARARLLEALARCFEAEPTPILIDDLQWADAASLEFCHFLVSRGRVRIYGAYRSSEVSPALAKTISAWHSSGNLCEIKLEPLKPEHVNALLASLTGIEVGPPRFSAWLANASGGNPFFALETLKALFESDLLTQKDGIWQSQLDEISFDYNELRVPTKVAAVIEQRLSRLSEAARRAVQAASVMRQGFQAKTLSNIIGLSEFATLDALEEAQHSSLIATDCFLHDLIRQGVYQGLPDARRKFLHGKVASILEHVAEPLVVAEHWLEAAAPEKAYLCFRLAAKTYQQHGLLEEALFALNKALEFAVDARETFQIQFELARVYLALSRIPDTERLIELVLAQTTDSELLALCLNTKAELLLHAGSVQQASETSAKAFKICAKAGLPTLELHTIGAEIAMLEERYEDAIAMLKPAIAHWRTKNPSSELVSLMTSLGTVYDQMGQPETGFKLHQEARQIAQTIGDKSGQVSVAMNSVWCLIALKRHEEALEVGERALALGEYIHTAVLHNNLGVTYFELERYSEARVHFETLTENRDDPTLRCMAWSRLARIYDKLQLELQRDQALEHGLALLDQTEYFVAHISMATSVLNLGTDDQVTRIKPYFRKELFPDPSVQGQFEEAFEKRFGKPWLLESAL
jgi:DNA-binding SARP family transcriptional activator